MSQSHRGSFVEAVTGTFIGLCYAVPANALIAYLNDIPLSPTNNFKLVFWMTIASVIRTYVVRRFFVWLPKWWKQFWCNHSFDFVDTKDDIMIQQCHHCDKIVKDRYGF